MANATRPWFQFHARDWLTDDKVMLMSLECQGAYLRLLCLQWENESIPNNEEAVATMLGFATKDSRRYFMDRLWPDLKPHFPTHREHKRRNKRMSRLRDAAIGKSLLRKKAGKKGGLQAAYRRQVSKQMLQHCSSDGDGDTDEEKKTNPDASIKT